MRSTPGGDARILVVDDDADIREMIVGQFAHEPYLIEEAGDLAGASAALAASPPDVMVLDLNLSDGDGLSFCRDIRAKGYAGAIIMVTARDAALDRVLGLELGADDYLTKPFEPRELLARVRNLVRRIGEKPERPSGRYACFAAWRLDLLQRRLTAPDSRLVMLSTAEFHLLKRFVEAPERVLSRETLLPERRHTVAYDRSLDIQVSRLRQKLASPGGYDLILTVRNEGYLFAAAVTFE